MKKLLTLAAAALLASSVANADYYVVGKSVTNEAGTTTGWDKPGDGTTNKMVHSELNDKTYYFKGKNIESEWKIFYVGDSSTWDYGYGCDKLTLNTASTEISQNSEGNIQLSTQKPFIVFYASGFEKGQILLGQWEDVTFTKDGSYYLLFDNTTAKWPAVNAYEYSNDNKSFAISTWPGKTMTRQIVDGKEYWVLKIASDKEVRNIKLFNPFDENDCIEIKDVDTEKLKSAVVLDNSGMTNTYKLEYGGTTEQPGETELPKWTSQTGKKYVFYDNSLSNWEKVSVYTYGSELNGDWPGSDATLMDVAGHELWVYAYDSNAVINNLIFNNGMHDDGGVEEAAKIQTETITSDFYSVYQGGATVNNKKVSNTITGTISADGKFVAVGSQDPDPQPAPELNYVDVTTTAGLTFKDGKYYFVFDNSNSNWSEIKVYAWKNENPNDDDKFMGKWPGTAMTQSSVNENYYYAEIPASVELEDIYGLVFNGKSGNESKQTSDIKEEVGTYVKNYAVYNGGTTPSAYLAFPADVIITNENVEGCFTAQEGIIHHDKHVAIHPNEKEGKSVELLVACASTGNAFDVLANEELDDHFSVSFKPLFNTDEFTFIKADNDGNPMYEEYESGKWRPVYEEESSYKGPKFGEFEYNEEDHTFYSHFRTDIAGDYEVTVKLDDYAYKYNLIPFKKTFKINVKPTLDALGLHFSATIGNTNYLGGYGIDEGNGNVLKTNLTKFSDEAIKKVDIKTGNHVPTRTLNIWYKLVDTKANAPRKAAASSDELVNDGYKKVTGLVDLTDVKNKTKNLSLVVEQNGSTSGNIDFSGDADITTEVEEIETEIVDAQARYFTLQGVEVSRLVPGIYIMVKGNESSKILVK